MYTSKFPGLRFVDINFRHHLRLKGLPTNLTPKVIPHKFLIGRVKSESRSNKSRRQRWGWWSDDHGYTTRLHRTEIESLGIDGKLGSYWKQEKEKERERCIYMRLFDSGCEVTPGDWMLASHENQVVGEIKCVLNIVDFLECYKKFVGTIFEEMLKMLMEKL